MLRAVGIRHVAAEGIGEKRLGRLIHVLGGQVRTRDQENQEKPDDLPEDLNEWSSDPIPPWRRWGARRRATPGGRDKGRNRHRP